MTALGSVCASHFSRAGTAAAVAQEPFITVASTTSTEESGLFGYLLAAFTKETGIQVRVVAVGTGQALKIGERGDCDVVFVHDSQQSLPLSSRASASTAARSCITTSFWSVRKAIRRMSMAARTSWPRSRKIADAKAPFVARGDDSGTSKAEMRLWKETGIDPKTWAEAGIAIPVRGWVRPSTPLPRWTAIRCPIVEHG